MGEDIFLVAWVLLLLIGIGLIQEGSIILGIMFLFVFAAPIVYFVHSICSEDDEL